MNLSEKFERFAAECEAMAKIAHTSENQARWKRMAERWLQCAELNERQTAAAQNRDQERRHRAAPHSWTS
jgi:hypothetical protein